ncbi:MAG: hypothetical protein QG591_2527 [Planctomycetota bacterium]|nr:hypothetical protein [Planctomycetota bacterium]
MRFYWDKTNRMWPNFYGKLFFIYEKRHPLPMGEHDVSKLLSHRAVEERCLLRLRIMY